jgi:hypothetical protein
MDISDKRRVEREHNEGIPRHEWEPFAAIIDGALEQGLTLAAIASTYDLPRHDLMVWHSRRQRTRIQIRNNALRPSNGPSRATIAMRLHRGMSAHEAVSRPAMTPHQRAQRAALSRWERQW